MFKKTLQNLGIVEKEPTTDKPSDAQPQPQSIPPIVDQSQPISIMHTNTSSNTEHPVGENQKTVMQKKLLESIYGESSFGLAKRFLNTLDQFEDIILDPKNRIFAAFKAITVDGTTKEQLLDSFNSSNQVVEQITESFNQGFMPQKKQTVEALEQEQLVLVDSINKLETQISELAKQIGDSKKRKNELADNIIISKQDLQSSNNNFLLAKEDVIKIIQSNITNITNITNINV